MLTGESETVSPSHTALLNQCIKKIKDTGSRLSGDHKELHGMVSKVGKAIDKVCFRLISDRSSCGICGYCTNCCRKPCFAFPHSATIEGLKILSKMQLCQVGYVVQIVDRCIDYLTAFRLTSRLSSTRSCAIDVDSAAY